VTGLRGTLHLPAPQLLLTDFLDVVVAHPEALSQPRLADVLPFLGLQNPPS
jgi:hypothetical protein